MDGRWCVLVLNINQSLPVSPRMLFCYHLLILSNFPWFSLHSGFLYSISFALCCLFPFFTTPFEIWNTCKGSDRKRKAVKAKPEWLWKRERDMKRFDSKTLKHFFCSKTNRNPLFCRKACKSKTSKNTTKQSPDTSTVCNRNRRGKRGGKERFVLPNPERMILAVMWYFSARNYVAEDDQTQAWQI